MFLDSPKFPMMFGPETCRDVCRRGRGKKGGEEANKSRIILKIQLGEIRLIFHMAMESVQFEPAMWLLDLLLQLFSSVLMADILQGASMHE